MKEEKRKEDFGEAAKNAFAGYMVVLLAIVCFILFLVAVSAVVRIIVGASSGVGV